VEILDEGQGSWTVRDNDRYVRIIRNDFGDYICMDSDSAICPITGEMVNALLELAKEERL
jgi:hypothetical protein